MQHNMPMHSQMNMAIGEYEDEADDIRVKVRDGFAGVYREYRDNQWIFSEIYGDKNLSKTNDRPLTASQGAAQVRYQYDDASRLVAVLDQYGEQVLWLNYVMINATQRVVQVRDARNRTVSYSYDSRGNLTNVVGVGGYVTRYSYDSKNRLVAKDLPSGKHVGISYDDNGLVKQVGNKHFQFTYDTGRKEYYASVLYASGRREERWFDHSGQEVRWAMDGRVLAAREAAAEIEETWPKVTRNERGDISSVVWPDGTSRIYEYNGPNFQITRLVDERGLDTRYAYDGAGRLVHMVEAAGTPRQLEGAYTYDSFGNALSMTVKGTNEQAELQWRWTYDTADNLLTETDPWGRVVSNQHDNVGNLLVRDEGNGRIWRYTVDERGRQVSAEDPWGRVSSNRYDAADHLVWEQNFDGQEATWEYNADGRMVSAGNEWGETLTQEYDVSGRLVRSMDFTGQEQQFEYDADGQLILPAVMDGLTYERDAAGHVVKITYPDERESVFTYDGATGLLLHEIHPNRDVTYRYDLDGNLVESVETAGSESRTNRWTYDQNGQMVAETDPAGRTGNYAYDILGDMIQATDPLGQEVEAEFSSDGRVTRFRDGRGEEIEFEYAISNRTFRQNQPDGVEKYTVGNPYGQTQEEGDSSGRMIQLEYDRLGQVTNVIYSCTNPVPTFQMESFQRDASGQITSYGNYAITGVIERTASASGQIVKVTVDYGEFTKAFEVAYNRNGMMTGWVGPGGEAVQYDYGDDGSLSITIPGEGVMVLRSDVLGEKREITFPGGLRQELFQDGFKQVRTNRVTDSSGNPIRLRTYSYHGDSRLAAMSTAGETKGYAYDAAGRLVRVDHSRWPENPEIYSYDAAGNRYGGAETNGGWLFTNGNRLVSWPSGAYEYDAAGRVVRRTVEGVTQQFDYDAAGRLVTVRDGASNWVASYVYDPAGRRIGKMTSVFTNWYLYGPSGLVGEYDSAGQAIREYGRLPGDAGRAGPLWRNQDGARAYYLSDPFEAADMLVNANGAAVWTGYQTGFGSVLEEEGSGDPLRQSDQFWDEETGLHYNTFRYYDPVTGRYLTPDPAGYNEGLNLYAFCWNDPVNLADLTGLAPAPKSEACEEWKWDAKTCTWDKYCNSLKAAQQAAAFANLVYSLGDPKLTAETDDYSMIRRWPPNRAWWRIVSRSWSRLSGFEAALYKNKCDRCILAFAGTTWWSLSDWRNNAWQGVGGDPTQYEMAREAAREARRACGDKLVITGHSLGGGLANMANQALGGQAPTITFNAAGLTKANQLAKNFECVQSFHVKGEILNWLQDKTWMGNNTGTRIPLPPGKKKGHSMDAVTGAIDLQIKTACKDYNKDNTLMPECPDK